MITMLKSAVASIALSMLPVTTLALEPMPSNPSGFLKVSVFVTDSTEFIKEWVGTPSTHSPTIKRIKEARYDQTVHAGFAITGFTKDNNSYVDFVVSAQVNAPDGTILLQKKQWARHNNIVTTDRGIIIADPVLDITIEHSDPPGIYTISAEVTDNLTGQKSSGSATLEIK